MESKMEEPALRKTSLKIHYDKHKTETKNVSSAQLLICFQYKTKPIARFFVCSPTRETLICYIFDSGSGSIIC